MSGEKSDIWCEVYDEDGGRSYWRVYHFRDGQDYLIAKSDYGYSNPLDAVDAANEYCDQHNLTARWNVPMAV